jgi:hypothetical protein
MQPPVVRKQIIEAIRRRGEPMKIQSLEGLLKLPYGNILQSCARAANAGELVRTGPAEYGLPDVTYHFETVPRQRRASTKSVVIPRQQRRSADVISPWLSRKLGAD